MLAMILAGAYPGAMTEPRWLDDEEMRAWRALLGASLTLQAILDDELAAEHGFGIAEYEVLVLLSEHPGRRMRMSELAARLHLSPSGLTRRLDNLAARGWVARERCPSDKRGTYAVLTDLGFAELERAAPTHVRGVRRHFVDLLSPDQLSAVANVLEQVQRDCTESAAS